MAASPEIAIARWLAQGFTSATHPVLQWTLAAFFHPLGIEAESLEAEPFSALESGGGEFWLRRPRWNAARFDRSQAAREDFQHLLDHPEAFIATVDGRGLLQFFPRQAGAEDPGLAASRHSWRAAADAGAFIFAAAGLLLANDPIAENYLQGNDAAFCRAVAERSAASRDR
jgi:hypothetical protein